MLGTMIFGGCSLLTLHSCKKSTLNGHYMDCYVRDYDIQRLFIAARTKGFICQSAGLTLNCEEEKNRESLIQQCF